MLSEKVKLKKNYILDDSIYLTFQKGQIIEIKKASVVAMRQGGGSGEKKRERN